MKKRMKFFEASSLNPMQPLLHIVKSHTFRNAQKYLSLCGLMPSRGQ